MLANSNFLSIFLVVLKQLESQSAMSQKLTTLIFVHNNIKPLFNLKFLFYQAWY